jgi:hypothetical protein
METYAPSELSLDSARRGWGWCVAGYPLECLESFQIPVPRMNNLVRRIPLVKGPRDLSGSVFPWATVSDTTSLPLVISLRFRGR